MSTKQSRAKKSPKRYQKMPSFHMKRKDSEVKMTIDKNEFILLGKGMVSKHECVLVQSIDPIIYYKSMSDTTWRLCALYKETTTTFIKGPDYVQSNLVDYRIQAWIEKNYENLSVIEDVVLLQLLKDQHKSKQIYRHIEDSSRELTNQLTYEMTPFERADWFSNRIWEESLIKPLHEYLYSDSNWNYDLPFPKCGNLLHYDNPRTTIYSTTDINASYQLSENSLHLSHLMESLFDVKEPEYITSYETTTYLDHDIRVSCTQTIFHVPLSSKHKDAIPFDIMLTYSVYDMTYQRETEHGEVKVEYKKYHAPLALTRGVCTVYGTYSEYMTIGNYVCKPFEYLDQLPREERQLRKCSALYGFIGDYFLSLYPLQHIIRDVPSQVFTPIKPGCNLFGYPMQAIIDPNYEALSIEQVTEKIAEIRRKRKIRLAELAAMPVKLGGFWG